MKTQLVRLEGEEHANDARRRSWCDLLENVQMMHNTQLMRLEGEEHANDA